MPAVEPKGGATTGPDLGGSITFSLNGTKHTVRCDTGRYTSRSSLSEYVRDEGFIGVKTPCQEGGCGACAVTVTVPDVQGGDALTTHSINACLCPLFSVDGWQITTTEGLGNQKEGYHPIQKRIAKFNGSQCGYCTPGVVMSMYGLLQKNPKPTQQEVEDNFDGNICRCTGYRAILDAMKSFSTDTSIADGGVIDIEDLNEKLCVRTGLPCPSGNDHANGASSNGAAANGAAASRPADNQDGGDSAGSGIGQVTRLNLQLSDGPLWIRPTSLQELGELLRAHHNAQVKMLAGNTAAGICKSKNTADVYIDIKYVTELSERKVSDAGIVIGANTSVSDVITCLESHQSSKPGFAYFSTVAEHLRKIGNVMVRNAGSIGGNLMMKYAHPGFPSDAFTVLEAAGAGLEIYDSKDDSKMEVSLADFVSKISMEGKVLTAVRVKPLGANDHFRTFKIAPRSQNALAYVNAAFRLKLTEDSRQILGKPSLVFGGIDDKTIHAKRTEQFLTGQEMNSTTVKGAVELLKSEMSPTLDPIRASPEYRRDLAGNLLYKTLLDLCKTSDPRLSSGGSSLERPLSSGIQTFQEKTDERPLKQPMPKVTSLIQAAGEAQFINDIPRFQRELSAAFVLSTVANARIQSVDPAPALALPGVHRFISASDIPEGGHNQLMTHNSVVESVGELFSTGKITHAGQSLGLILAETESLANRAAKLVDVKYTDIQQPILTIQQGIEAGSFHPIHTDPVIVGKPDEALQNAKNVVEGTVAMGTQYHFYLENQVSLCVPSEDGIELYTAMQHCDMAQSSVAAVLGKPVSYVNCHVPRLGGGFGGKARSYPCMVACAAAVASNATGRPVRLNLSLSSCMAATGKRFPVMAKYKAGFSDEGVMEVIQVDVYADGGTDNLMADMVDFVVQNMDHGYYVPNWKVIPHNVRTNKPTNGPMRGPGHVPTSLIIETIMEHVAKSVNKHPIFVKELNLYEKHQTDIGFGGHVLMYCTMRDVWKQLKELAEVEKRLAEVEAFNAANRWKKRALTMSAVKHGMYWAGTGFPAQVSIFAEDGTVVVSQAGVEMGQGLYTKVAQATAHALGIPLDFVKVRPNQTLIANNAFETGGSSTSEQCVQAILECCKILRERMAPIKNKHPDADWVTLCRKALESGADLGARFTNFGEPGRPFFHHFVYCAGAYETEVDVLTGEYIIRRVDIMYDCGESLNPTIDIGQIEGAFVMGLGCHLLEDIVYDKETGRILNDGTWEYKLPTTKDIPIDWRIHLLPDAPNPIGVRSSKAVGEPPLSLGCGPLLALKQSIEAVLQESNGSSPFLPVESPLTVEKIQQACKVAVEHMQV